MKNISIKAYYLIAVISSAILIGLDQWTKQLAVTHLMGQESINIIEGVFCLQYLENTGAAFGIMKGQLSFFLITTSIVLILLAYVYGKTPTSSKFLPLRICMVLIFSGAVGNLIDRISYNYVIDFLYFELIDFPIFNVADIYVTATTFVLVILFLFYYKDEDLSEIQLLKKKSK